MHMANCHEGQDEAFSLVEEHQLIERAKHDENAFAVLYLRHVDQVYRYLRTHTENEEDASDLTQQVFLSALAALPRYQSRDLPFAAWLTRIARNAAIDTYRSRRRVMPWDHIAEQILPCEAISPEEAAIKRERINHIRLLVAQLDTDKQELLALRFAADLSSREIGELVGRSEAAIQKQLVRTMHWLREKYREWEQL
jgi:RNA polymerase sigma-70 factor, ECF subfamily